MAVSAEEWEALISRPVANKFSYPEPLQPDTAAALCDFFRPFNERLVTLLADQYNDEQEEEQYFDRSFVDQFHWHCSDGNRALAPV